ncbi:hypothetical protein [Paenibacillus amylolyticus]|uniref:hypothetical protein n=1 Tax=Paenibacillus amylolyticus TaxID=1451 RepID=UPI003EC0D83C
MKMNLVSVVKRYQTHRGIEKSDKLILNLTRLKISFVLQLIQAKACLKLSRSFCKQNVLLTRCSVFKDQTYLATETSSFQQLLYIIMPEPTLQALFFQVSFEACFPFACRTV